MPPAFVLFFDSKKEHGHRLPWNIIYGKSPVLDEVLQTYVDLEGGEVSMTLNLPTDTLTRIFKDMADHHQNHFTYEDFVVMAQLLYTPRKAFDLNQAEEICRRYIEANYEPALLGNFMASNPGVFWMYSPTYRTLAWLRPGQPIPAKFREDFVWKLTTRVLMDPKEAPLAATMVRLLPLTVEELLTLRKGDIYHILLDPIIVLLWGKYPESLEIAPGITLGQLVAKFLNDFFLFKPRFSYVAASVLAALIPRVLDQVVLTPLTVKGATAQLGTYQGHYFCVARVTKQPSDFYDSTSRHPSTTPGVVILSIYEEKDAYYFGDDGAYAQPQESWRSDRCLEPLRNFVKDNLALFRRLNELDVTPAEVSEIRTVFQASGVTWGGL